MNKSAYKVGDKIVELGQVFRIFKIQKKKNGDGKFEDVVFFRPYYKPAHSQNFVCSIPLENIEKTEIRRPISKKRVKVILNKLKKSKKNGDFPPILQLKDLLKSNKTSHTVRVVRILSKEKKTNPDNFSKSKRDIFESAVERLVQEIAIVTGVTQKTARKKIDSALQN